LQISKRSSKVILGSHGCPGKDNSILLNNSFSLNWICET